MEKPRAVLFDAYGTLFDVYSVGLLAEQLFPGQGQALAVLWRDKQIEYAVRSAGLEGLLDHVLSVDSVRKYKTHPDAYQLGLQATGLAARQIVFVSCNSWDALAATWFGYRTLWVNRYRLPFEELATQPERTGSSLRDVLSFF
jgi:FMN phosphatase YigB (HAD superfamily)